MAWVLDASVVLDLGTGDPPFEPAATLFLQKHKKFPTPARRSTRAGSTWATRTTAPPAAASEMTGAVDRAVGCSRTDAPAATEASVPVAPDIVVAEPTVGDELYCSVEPVASLVVTQSEYRSMI